ncbi:exonuclease [Salmonella enterica subsp. enterica serovar Arechavaleta]|uniref:Exonuclease n=1 Tax=Salmonella enterica TaxID=28901 RepID=A0A755S2V9_SALER|nr:exonuclease [Salmonella enterica subsp. enterica serovar Arechavaleta]EAO6397632.1 exonuclease [Salmonella enterica]EBF8682955.1 exonuclease [Salmonella enterica subsp. enterica]EDB4403929.1 exonuclease [Salmonella enterica subsp. enterica serovar Schwarzengrund]EAW0407798.1 exonuclease [Salmonella enterica]
MRSLIFISQVQARIPEFIEKMDEALKEIGFTFGEQWR